MSHIGDVERRNNGKTKMGWCACVDCGVELILLRSQLEVSNA